MFYDDWEHDIHLLVIILLLYVYTSVHKSCRKYYWQTLACKVVVGSVSGSGARATGPSEIITFIDGGKKIGRKKNTRSLIGGDGLWGVLCFPNIASGSTRLSPFSADTRYIATSSITIIICILAYYNVLCTSVRRCHPSIIIPVRLVQLYKVGIIIYFFCSRLRTTFVSRVRKSYSRQDNNTIYTYLRRVARPLSYSKVLTIMWYNFGIILSLWIYIYPLFLFIMYIARIRMYSLYWCGKVLECYCTQILFSL